MRIFSREKIEPPLPPLRLSAMHRARIPQAAPKPDSLYRCLRSRRHASLTRALTSWRLSLSHLLRLQSLQRLRAQSQEQQQQFAALRRAAPFSARQPMSARPGGARPSTSDDPAGAGGSTGGGPGALVRDALLARLVRATKRLSLGSALARWRLTSMQLLHDALHDASRASSTSATAPRALRRASAQESQIATLREQLTAAVADGAEKTRALALAQRQLATATERRRIAESGNRSAQDSLTKLQRVTGASHERDAELLELRNAEEEWRAEAARLIGEQRLVTAELASEERSFARRRPPRCAPSRTVPDPLRAPGCSLSLSHALPPAPRPPASRPFPCALSNAKALVRARAC